VHPHSARSTRRTTTLPPMPVLPEPEYPESDTEPLISSDTMTWLEQTRRLIRVKNYEDPHRLRSRRRDGGICAR
jgi:hypothetical protein